MTLLIDTRAVPARDRAEYWAESARGALYPLQIRTEADQPFAARMWGERLGSIGFLRIAAAANTMRRTPSDVAAGDPDCLLFHIVLQGHLQVAWQQRTTALGPGTMTAYDTSRSTIVRAPGPFEVLAVRLAKASLGMQGAAISRLTGVQIAADRGLPRLVARFICEAATGLADGSIARDDTGLEGHVIDLVRRLYVDLGSTSRRLPRPSMAELRLQAEAEIEARLSDPGLTPEQIARACAISTRYLHRVFESEERSVCEFIRAARLDRCRRDLLDPALADQAIQTIAARWGLPSAPHFSRLFREAYGCSPREFRRTGPRAHAAAWARAGWE